MTSGVIRKKLFKSQCLRRFLHSPIAELLVNSDGYAGWREFLYG